MSDWVDITVACRSAAAEMTDTNPMIHIDDFSLFNSMNATEVIKFLNASNGCYFKHIFFS
jgi:hypothetical protein